MAVRDEERQPYDAAEWNGRNLPWRDALGHLPAVLIASGLILYGYLSLGYYSFYGRLGVDPNDVGLSYAGTLTRSSGFAVTCLLGVIFLLPPPFLQRRPRVQRKLSRVPNGAQRVIAVAILSTTMGLMLGWAHGAAARVEDGVPVRPIHLPGPLLSTFILLAIHAIPPTSSRPASLASSQLSSASDKRASSISASQPAWWSCTTPQHRKPSTCRLARSSYT
jgi:hypothetical protein